MDIRARRADIRVAEAFRDVCERCAVPQRACREVVSLWRAWMSGGVIVMVSVVRLVNAKGG
jgi:hypothetical protein